MNHEIEQRAISLMVEMLGIELDRIVPTASLVDDLNLDSIDMIDILMKLSDEFDLDLNPHDFENCLTVNDFTIILKQKVLTKK